MQVIAEDHNLLVEVDPIYHKDKTIIIVYEPIMVDNVKLLTNVIENMVFLIIVKDLLVPTIFEVIIRLIMLQRQRIYIFNLYQEPI